MNTDDVSNKTFHDDASQVLTQLRTKLAEVIAAVPDHIGKGADLKRALNIDKKLSWKVFKVASTIDPLSVGPHVPGRTNMTQFFNAARKRGVPKTLIDSASQVADEFERVVTTHAGDRATFDTMVSSLASDETTEQIDLVHRRLGFRSQRHVLGVQAKTHQKLFVFRPSEDPAQLDLMRVEGFIGLSRLRGDAPLIVSYSGASKDDGSPLAMRREPLDCESNACGMSLLSEFCSQPLPEIKAIDSGMGFIQGELITKDIGNLAAVNCIEGHIMRAAFPRYSQEGNRMSGTVAAVRMPCEVLILDLMVSKEAFPQIKPRAFVQTEHHGVPWSCVGLERYRLPAQPTINYLGRGPSALHTPDVPRYAEMGKYVFERAGWNGDDFDLYRCRIEYPVMPSSVAVQFDLPERPA